jgi:hypothetical protein
MDIISLIADDWKKIPANHRYLILSGATLIFNSWLLDHWGGKNIYKFWIWDIRKTGYSLGLTLVLVSLTMIALKQILLFGNIFWLRNKFQIKKINQDFFLLSFKGYVVLFDNRERKYFHIYNWETAQDLLFVERWIYLSTSFPPDIEDLIPIENTKTHSHKFGYYTDGGPINTRQ